MQSNPKAQASLRIAQFRCKLHCGVRAVSFAGSRNIVPSCRTGTSSEIRNDNLQVTVTAKCKKTDSTKIEK
jgi:hypothetical protein